MVETLKDEMKIEKKGDKFQVTNTKVTQMEPKEVIQQVEHFKTEIENLQHMLEIRKDLFEKFDKQYDNAQKMLDKQP